MFLWVICVYFPFSTFHLITIPCLFILSVTFSAPWTVHIPISTVSVLDILPLLVTWILVLLLFSLIYYLLSGQELLQICLQGKLKWLRLSYYCTQKLLWWWLMLLQTISSCNTIYFFPEILFGCALYLNFICFLNNILCLMHAANGMNTWLRGM